MAPVGSSGAIAITLSVSGYFPFLILAGESRTPSSINGSSSSGTEVQGSMAMPPGWSSTKAIAACGWGAKSEFEVKRAPLRTSDWNVVRISYLKGNDGLD